MDEFEKREKLKAHWRNPRLLQKGRTLCGLKIEYMRSPEALTEEVITCQKCKRVLEAHRKKPVPMTKLKCPKCGRTQEIETVLYDKVKNGKDALGNPFHPFTCICGDHIEMVKVGMEEKPK